MTRLCMYIWYVCMHEERQQQDHYYFTKTRAGATMTSVQAKVDDTKSSSEASTDAASLQAKNVSEPGPVAAKEENEKTSTSQQGERSHQPRQSLPAATTSAASPSITPTTTKTLFVANLSNRLQYTHLEKLFSKYGIILRLDLKTNKNGGNSSNYCFCEFDSLEQARLCQRQLHGRTLCQRQLVVQEAHGRQQEGGMGRPAQPRKRTARQEQRDVSLKIQEIKAKLASKNKM